MGDCSPLLIVAKQISITIYYNISRKTRRDYFKHHTRSRRESHLKTRLDYHTITHRSRRDYHTITQYTLRDYKTRSHN